MTRHDTRRESRSEATEESAANTMGDVDHTHPHQNTTFGSIFGRGPTVAADGGRPAARDDGTSTGQTPGPATMGDVDHESPTGTDASGAFERGAAASTDNGGVRDDE